MKRFLATLLIGVILTSNTVFAQTNITYNNATVSYSNQEPVIINNRTYVPIRDVFETLGFEVSWDQDTKTVSLENGFYYTFINTVDSRLFCIDSAMNMRAIQLEDKVQLINGSIMLPMREILEYLNYEIQWNDSTKTSTIIDNNDYAQMTAENEKILAALDSEVTSYTFDESREAGSLTEEESEYLATVSQKADELEAYVSSIETEDINLYKDEIIARAQEIFSIPCPDSLVTFKDAMQSSLTATGTYLYDVQQALKTYYVDLESESSDGSLFGILLMLAARVSYENLPMKEALITIATERNLPEDTFIDFGINDF